MHPDEITSILRLKPVRCWKRGDKKRTPAGTSLEGVYPGSYWYCDLEHGEEMELSEFLGSIVSKLKLHRAFFKTIRSGGGAVEIYVGWFSPSNSGEVLDWKLLRNLANLRIDFALDIYVENDKQ